MIHTRKEIKNILKSSCHGVLNDLLNDVDFNKEEAFLFKERYINEHSVPWICFMLPCGTNKYNYMHNRILDKIISHFNRSFSD